MPKGLKKLFEGVDGLSADFITEAEQIVEARVEAIVTEKLQEAENAHVAEISALKESHAKELDEVRSLVEGAEGAAIDKLVENVDMFLEQEIGKWASENALGIDSQIKVGLAEGFLTGLAGLMKEHNVTVPEGAENLVEAQEKEISELTEQCNALMAENMQYKADEKTKLSEGVIAAVCEGLADTQVDTIRSLVEGVEFKDEAHFRMRVEAAKQVVEGKGTKKEGEDEDGEKEGVCDEGDKKTMKESHVPGQPVVLDEDGKQVTESDATVASVLAFLHG